MEKAYQYIKRLLAFLLCTGLFVFSLSRITYFVTLPFLVLAFSLLHARITGEKPPHLFVFHRTETYFKKGGLRDLLRIFVTLLGFISDTIIWTIWGVYQVFILIIDMIYLVKTILYWIIHAILWFLRQYVPFFIFLYRLTIHYLVRWPWWLYRISWYNIRYAYNRNAYRIALNGTLQAMFILFLFYYLQIVLENIQGLIFIGLLIAMLPITWSFGEIAVIRVNKAESEPYKVLRNNFSNGIEAVRSVLFYITVFVVLLLAQLGLNLTGWMPDYGILVAGFVFNLNTFISFLLIALCILIIFGVFCIPSYRLYTEFSETRLTDTITLLRTLGKKFLQYLLVLIPTSFFTLVTLILPFLILMIVYALSFTLKNEVVQIKINKLETEQASITNPVKAYEIGKKIKQLNMLQQFPENIYKEMIHRKNLSNTIALTKEDIEDTRVNFLSKSADYETKLKSLSDQIEDAKSRPGNGDLLDQLYRDQQQTGQQYRNYKLFENQKIARSEIDLKYLMLNYKHIPILFFAAGLWLMIFGGSVIAFGIAYLGNVFHQLFIFRNNNFPSEWIQIVKDIRTADHKQPLLGGTLTIITLIMLFFLINNYNFIDQLSVFFQNR